MNSVCEKLSNGNTINYQVVNGTAYHAETCQEVIDVLENAMHNDLRIRVFYGDSMTGKDWTEENDIIGTIGRSSGSIKIPLLVKTSSSYGGGSLLDNCIVKITLDKMVVYEHDYYNIEDMANMREAISDGSKVYYLQGLIRGSIHIKL